MENLHVKFEGDAPKEMVWLQGTAAAPLPNREPKIINLTGDIGTVMEFVAVRKDTAAGLQVIDHAKAVVVVNKTARTITLLLDPENHYGATVTGKLEVAPELQPFQINGNTFGREALLKVVRFNRMWFNDSGVHTALVNGLSNVTIKTATELQQANDHKGNKTSKYDVKATVPPGWVEKFDLLVPIFKGGQKIKFEVEICFEVTPTGFSFWLESPQLVEFTAAELDGIFESALTGCEEYVTVNQ